ncbi:hypothetical protein BBJ29_005858 [Phytophthora kernoviae]|uniref:Nucleotide-diphospho-sugar transferase domain-containing protein n=1 Tax=Phytophthora kernoviae TaxID=325452 RepID=A0A3F2RIW1_9STRA|nr:hypothetical protein BBJ29_005858 [Phytophthora kernoviae]RLN57606.1 hypothetical protein BBP00_00007429 [Phytophthora kernoviae]
MERRFKCIGWRATANCQSDGPRIPEHDRPCTKTVPTGQAGYCELRDEDSGELFRVARRTCDEAVGKAALFRCLEAPRFANFHVLTHKVMQRALKPGFMLPNMVEGQSEPRDGIVMVVYPKIVPSAYASIRVLREVLGCRLPIEIWFRPDEMRKVTASSDPLRQLAANDTIEFREIDDPLAIEFATKVFAIYHSTFDRVLFLDSDNVPVRDPSFLFQSAEFIEAGAVFWPDFWQPSHTLFNLHKDSLLWELLQIPFVDMFEQESGQVLIDRRRHGAPLEIVHFFTFHRPNPFVQLKLVWGDKDLFRLAWLKLQAPFHMIETPLAVAGKAINGYFCGMTMVQHDAQGNVLFLHRNSHKLTGGRIQNPADKKTESIRGKRWSMEDSQQVEASATRSEGYPDPAIWTHLLSFHSSSPRTKYEIETYHAEPEFSKDQICYGQHRLGANKYFYVQDIADMNFSGMETDLRRVGDYERSELDSSVASYPVIKRNSMVTRLNYNQMGGLDKKVGSQEGIVMVVYPKLIASAFATIRTLRDVLGCRLPIEIWYRQDEINKVPGSLRPLKQLAQNDTAGEIIFREINDSQAVRFGAKVFAIYNSGFDCLLFLDADNVPVRDPTFLFDSPEFVKTGAVFWPDYWHPGYTIFHLHGDSLLWELLDMSYVDMFEQESGQLLIDRRRHAAPLELVRFFTFHRPNPIEKLKLLWGDKDLFRLAWIKLDMPFHMIQTPPAVAGTVTGESFCGMTMVQHDAQGEVLFLHRNAKKLTGEFLYKPVNYRVEARKHARSKLIKLGIHALPSEEAVLEELAAIEKTPPQTLEPSEPDGIADQIIWTHLLSFRKGSPRSEYKVKSYRAAPDFPKTQRCYGERFLGRSKHFEAQSFADLSFSGLETHLRRFAMEAAHLRQAQ